MKYILCFLILLSSYVGFSQTIYVPIGSPFGNNMQRLSAQKTFTLPSGISPTLNGGIDSAGALFYNKIDSSLYVYYGGNVWGKVKPDTGTVKSYINGYGIAPILLNTIKVDSTQLATRLFVGNAVAPKDDKPVSVGFSPTIAIPFNKVSAAYTQTGIINFTGATTGNTLYTSWQQTVIGNGQAQNVDTTNIRWDDDIRPQWDKINTYNWYVAADGIIHVTVKVHNANYANLVPVNAGGFTTYIGYDWTTWIVNNTSGNDITVSAGTTSGGTNLVAPTLIHAGYTTLKFDNPLFANTPVYFNNISNTSYVNTSSGLNNAQP